jgi:hypothetical protein
MACVRHDSSSPFIRLQYNTGKTHWTQLASKEIDDGVLRDADKGIKMQSFSKFRCSIVKIEWMMIALRETMRFEAGSNSIGAYPCGS